MVLKGATVSEPWTWISKFFAKTREGRERQTKSQQRQIDDHPLCDMTRPWNQSKVTQMTLWEKRLFVRIH